MRYWSLILLVGTGTGWAASLPANTDAASRWERDGRSLFLACEFKQAARAFEKALAAEPASAHLYFWAGKSYARLAEISSPLSAPRNARAAQRGLEQAVAIDPRNEEYLRELFDFYVDSPQWFGGGLERAAALLERIGSEDPGAELRLAHLADSREEYGGAEWWMRRAALRTAAVAGYLVPQR